jgi:hypothetical protein
VRNDDLCDKLEQATAKQWFTLQQCSLCKYRACRMDNIDLQKEVGLYLGIFVAPTTLNLAHFNEQH